MDPQIIYIRIVDITHIVYSDISGITDPDMGRNDTVSVNFADSLVVAIDNIQVTTRIDVQAPRFADSGKNRRSTIAAVSRSTGTGISLNDGYTISVECAVSFNKNGWIQLIDLMMRRQGPTLGKRPFASYYGNLRFFPKCYFPSGRYG